MMRNLVLLAAATTLAACQPAADNADNGAVNTPAAEPVAPPMANAANEAEPASNAVAAAKPINIPEQFRGRWGLNANDCKAEFASAAKGLLVINDARLTFYESRGTLDRVDAWEPANRFTANYGFSGEGMNWERVITLERTGNKLRRTEEGGEEGPVDLTYSVCPA
jgi:hypothetical protein